MSDSVCGERDRDRFHEAYWLLALLVSILMMTMLCAYSDEHVLFAGGVWGELETYVVFPDNFEPSLLTKNEHEGK
jgi:hypothetical protein